MSTTRTRCYYCANEAVVCCEERIPGEDKLRTCPRVVCNRHVQQVDGLWKCLGHALPADEKKPWEK